MKKMFCVLIVVCLALSAGGCFFPQYQAMTMEEILELEDEEMIVALLMQFDGNAPFEELNEAQKAVYTAAALELEVLNGGMVQFLANEAEGAAPYICEALKEIGATEHLELLECELKKAGVDLNDVSEFTTEDMEAFSALYDRYNFDLFDSSYETLPSMPELIRTYIRNHFEELGG